MSSKRILYDFKEDSILQNVLIDDAVNFIFTMVKMDAPDFDKIDSLIDLYRSKLFYSVPIVTAIGFSTNKYSVGMAYLLKNIRAPCLIKKNTNPKLLEELTPEVLRLIILDYQPEHAATLWDEDILDACKKYGEDFYTQLSYYKKGEERDSNFINWCIDTINTTIHENKVDALYVKGMPTNTPLIRIEAGTVYKETVNYKTDCLKEYYFYKVLNLNRNGIKQLRYEQIQLPTGVIKHYTAIVMKKYTTIKSITCHMNDTGVKYGIINDKLLIKYTLQRLRSLFNRSIIHGDIKVDNILINKRTRNKCILIDYEHSLDLKDKYFHRDTKLHMISVGIDILSYKCHFGQMLDDRIYSYKADIVNLIYSVVSKITRYEDNMETLQKIAVFNKHIAEHPFYYDLVTVLDSYSEEEITNQTYNRLIEITNYHIMMNS